MFHWWFHCRPIFYLNSITRVTTSTVPTDIPSADPGTDSSFIHTFPAWYTTATVTIFFQLFSKIFSRESFVSSLCYIINFKLRSFIPCWFPFLVLNLFKVINICSLPSAIHTSFTSPDPSFLPMSIQASVLFKPPIHFQG